MNQFNKTSYFAYDIDISTLALSHILGRKNISVAFKGDIKLSHHYINLREPTIDLISKIWGDCCKEIFREAYVLHSSISSIGNEIIEREDKVVVISYSKLLNILLKHSTFNRNLVISTDSFEVISKFTEGIQVGNRGVYEYMFQLKNNLCQSSYHEGTDIGWLFTFPISKSEGILQISTSANRKVTLKKLKASLKGTLSENIIKKDTLVKRGFHQTSPRISSNIISKKHINIGGGLLRFDPICGDGTGLAIKSAILASGIILSSNPDYLKIFYKSKVSNIFNNHLLSCISIYSKYHHGMWNDEILGMKEVQQFIQNNICDNIYLNYKIDFIRSYPTITSIEGINTA